MELICGGEIKFKLILALIDKYPSGPDTFLTAMNQAPDIFLMNLLRPVIYESIAPVSLNRRWMQEISYTDLNSSKWGIIFKPRLWQLPSANKSQ